MNPASLKSNTWKPLVGNLGTLTWEPRNLALGKLCVGSCRPYINDPAPHLTLGPTPELSSLGSRTLWEPQRLSPSLAAPVFGTAAEGFPTCRTNPRLISTGAENANIFKRTNLWSSILPWLYWNCGRPPQLQSSLPPSPQPCAKMSMCSTLLKNNGWSHCTSGIFMSLCRLMFSWFRLEVVATNFGQNNTNLWGESLGFWLDLSPPSCFSSFTSCFTSSLTPSWQGTIPKPDVIGLKTGDWKL